MIAHAPVQPQASTNDKAYVIGIVKYGATSGIPDQYKPGQMVSNIVVDTADCELKVWGETGLMRTIAKGRTVVLEKSFRAKNWKVSRDENGKVRTSVEQIPDLEPFGSRTPKAAPAPKPQTSHQAIAGEITVLAGLYAQCYQAAKKELTGLAPEQTIQGAASSLFIQMNKVHDFDTLIIAAAEPAKADLGW